jgi:hypothetical protein
MDSPPPGWKNPAQGWATVAVAEFGCAAASQLRNYLTRDDLEAARRLIEDDLSSEKPNVARYLTNAFDEDARIARVVLRDGAILYKRDALRSALIDADCEDTLRPPPPS